MTQLELIEKRVPDKEKKIYIVGSYDNEPKKAAKKLKKMGYENAIPGGRMEEHEGPVEENEIKYEIWRLTLVNRMNAEK